MKNFTVDALFQDSFWRELPLCDDLPLPLQTCSVSSTFFLNFVPIILHDVTKFTCEKWLDCIVINYPPGKLT